MRREEMLLVYLEQIHVRHIIAHLDILLLSLLYVFVTHIHIPVSVGVKLMLTLLVILFQELLHKSFHQRIALLLVDNQVVVPYFLF